MGVAQIRVNAPLSDSYSCAKRSTQAGILSGTFEEIEHRIAPGCRTRTMRTNEFRHGRVGLV